jgi:hypothetical protein
MYTIIETADVDKVSRISAATIELSHLACAWISK